MAKKKKKPSIVYKIISFLLSFISIFLIGSIIYLNILSTGILMLVVAIILIVVLFLLLLMNKSRKKKLGAFISIILCLLFSLLFFYITKTTDFLSSLDLNYKTYNYSVVVLESSSYKKLKDINDKQIGYFDDGSSENDKSLNKILSKIEIEPVSYEDTHELANSLLEEEVEAILIEESYLDILSESITQEEKVFKDLVREIYSFVVVTKTSDISKDLNVTKEPFNIYVSGIDTYGEISSVSRSDVNMIVTVNPETRQILLTSIPRDYYVKLHGKSGYKDKLTHAGLYGTDMSIQTLEDLLDIEINYYVKVNFSSVINVVNAIGGVEVYSDYDFTSIDNYSYKKGYNEVNGEKALSFARERKAFALGDRQRVKNQQALLQAILDKCMSKAIITKYTKLLDSFQGSFVTNMKMSRLTSLVKLQVSKNYDWNLVSNSLAGSDSKNYTYSASSQKVYVMEPISSSVDYASKLIDSVLNGEILDNEEVTSGSKDANKISSNNISDTASNASKKDDTSLKKEEIESVLPKEEKLVAKLGRSEVSFVSGDDYIYYGYTVTYNGEDITDSSEINEKFVINGKTFDDYKELVLYVSNLECGSYKITYTIKYREEAVVLTQNVVIEEGWKDTSNDSSEDDDSVKLDKDDNKKQDTNSETDNDDDDDDENESES